MFKRRDQKWDQNAAVVGKILPNSQGQGVQFQVLVNFPYTFDFPIWLLKQTQNYSKVFLKEAETPPWVCLQGGEAQIAGTLRWTSTDKLVLRICIAAEQVCITSSPTSIPVCWSLSLPSTIPDAIEKTSCSLHQPSLEFCWAVGAAGCASSVVFNLVYSTESV